MWLGHTPAYELNRIEHGGLKAKNDSILRTHMNSSLPFGMYWGSQWCSLPFPGISQPLCYTGSAVAHSSPVPSAAVAMEILVDHSLGIPTDAILSVRCGGTRRQAPMETICNHPLKFPLGLGAWGLLSRIHKQCDAVLRVVRSIRSSLLSRNPWMGT